MKQSDAIILNKHYIQLLSVIRAIEEKLFHESPKVGKIAHYTSLHVLKSLADNKPFRLCNTAYMNDPDEGKVFFEIMKGNMNVNVQKMFPRNDSGDLHTSPAYIGSFVKTDSQKAKKDKLFLWRTYGKHDNEEAAGACLIFNAESFARTLPPRQTGALFQPQRQKIQPALFNVIYEREIKNKVRLKANLTKLASLLNDLHRWISSVKNDEDLIRLARSLVWELLDNIRFFFKADDYSEEREVRVVQNYYDTDGGKNQDRKVAMEHLPPRFYLEMPSHIHFSEVILGPKTADESGWKHWLSKKGITNVTKSRTKFR